MPSLELLESVPVAKQVDLDHEVIPVEELDDQHLQQNCQFQLRSAKSKDIFELNQTTVQLSKQPLQSLYDMSSNYPTPWHAEFPAPKSSAASLPRQHLLEWLQGAKTLGRDFVLVDLRKMDHEGGTISGSLNLPAQSLFPSIPAFYRLLAQTDVRAVVWFCGSCGGRGTRAADWFQDHLEEQQNDRIRSWKLDGGIKGWVRGGREFTELMIGYDTSKWSSI